MTLKSAEWATYSKTLGTQYGAFQLGWFPDYVDAENYLLPFYHSKSNFTDNSYKNTKMDALLNKEQGTKSLAKRLDDVTAGHRSPYEVAAEVLDKVRNGGAK